MPDERSASHPRSVPLIGDVYHTGRRALHSCLAAATLAAVRWRKGYAGDSAPLPILVRVQAGPPKCDARGLFLASVACVVILTKLS